MGIGRRLDVMDSILALAICEEYPSHSMILTVNGYFSIDFMTHIL